MKISAKVSIEKNIVYRSTFFEKRDSGEAVFFHRYFFKAKFKKFRKKGIPNEQKFSIDRAARKMTGNKYKDIDKKQKITI